MILGKSLIHPPTHPSICHVVTSKRNLCQFTTQNKTIKRKTKAQSQARNRDYREKIQGRHWLYIILVIRKTKHFKTWANAAIVIESSVQFESLLPLGLSFFFYVTKWWHWTKRAKTHFYSVMEAQQIIHSAVSAHLLPQRQQNGSLVATSYSPQVLCLGRKSDSLVLGTATHPVHSPMAETHLRQDNLAVPLKPFQGRLQWSQGQ